MAREPSLPYEFLFCDVRMELPETYAWIDSLEVKLGIKIVRVGKSLEEVIADEGMLPSQKVRYCTREAKIFPLQDYVGDDDVTQYLGIRADESERVGTMTKANIVPRYPLIEMGLGINHVYQILTHRGVMPPDFFWRRLYDAVVSRYPDLQPTADGLPPWDRAALFSWRSRSNCFMCFYQRRYEWVGLLEHHPELFRRAEQMEIDYGSGDRREEGVQFGWIQGLPLSELRKRADSIFDSRVRAVCRALSDIAQGKLFQDEFNPITTVGCGLYCGK